MKTLLFILASTLAFGQTASVNGSTVRYRFTGGSSAPSGGSCDASTELNSVYVRYGAPATYPTQMYLCKQTGTSTYAWEPIGYRSGTTAPAKCTVGDVFFDTDASAGQNLYGCTAADMWTLQTGGSGSGIGYTGTFTGTTATITAATHNQGIHPIIFLYDASGSAVTAPYHCLTSGSAAVACAGATSVGDIVIETVASATYTYTIIGGTATAPYSTTVSAVTSQSISAATHGQGALAVAWCFDNSTPRLVVSCSYTRNTSGDLVFSFSPAFTGQIQIGNGNSGGGSTRYTYFSGQQSAVSQTGSNVAAFSVSSVPALAAGHCYTIETGLAVSSNSISVAYSVYVDSTQLAAPYSGSGVGNSKFSLLLCNTTAQSAQQVTRGVFLYNAGNTNTGADYPYQNVTTNWIGTTSTDWSTTHTIYVYTNASSGTVTPNYIHITED